MEHDPHNLVHVPKMQAGDVLFFAGELRRLLDDPSHHPDSHEALAQTLRSPTGYAAMQPHHTRHPRNLRQALPRPVCIACLRSGSGWEA